MGRTAGPPPTLAELRQAFDELLDRAVAYAEMPPTETWLHPAVLDAIDDVARAAYIGAPTTEQVAKARKRFARSERARSRSDLEHARSANARQRSR